MKQQRVSAKNYRFHRILALKSILIRVNFSFHSLSFCYTLSMSRVFLYIDESKDIWNSQIKITVWVSKYRIARCNWVIQELKDTHGIISELHWYRRKTAQIFWNKITRDNFWERTDIFEMIYFFTFDNFVESWSHWNTIYSHILSEIRWTDTIYADKITLSRQDMKLLKYNIGLTGWSITFLNSVHNPIIQCIDLICWYIRDEKNRLVPK